MNVESKHPIYEIIKSRTLLMDDTKP